MGHNRHTVEETRVMDIKCHNTIHLSLWTNKMILSTYEEGNRLANVCKQGKEWVAMVYEDGQYLKTLLASSESHAEILAEDWVLNK